MKLEHALNIGALLFILGLCNRLIYFELKNNDWDKIVELSNLTIFLKLELFLLLICFAISLFWLYFSFQKYNTPPKEKTAATPFSKENYNVTEKNNGVIFWSVVYYPLFLCPLPDKLYLFIMTLCLIWGFTLFLLIHTSEIIISPIVIMSGYRMYLFEDKEKKEEPFYVLLKSNTSKNISVVKIEDNLYKEYWT